MPLTIPNLSDRKYQELLDEALARIPVHNPEWTNFNDSDPGVTIIQLFAFMTENLLYRSNQIPERNRRKFLRLLGVPLNPASPASGLVTVTNDRGALKTVTLGSNLEVRAGSVSFRTSTGMDVLPVEWRVVFKEKIQAPASVKSVYETLYMTYVTPGAQANFTYYQTTNLEDAAQGTGTQDGVNLLSDTVVDASLWIALLSRTTDSSPSDVRAAIAGRIVNIGFVPALSENDLERELSVGGSSSRSTANLLKFEIPVGGSLGAGSSQRVPRYRTLESTVDGDIFTGPCIAQVILPAKSEDLEMWDDIDPLEMGVGDLPPNFEDSNLKDRLLTWIRVRLAQQGASAQTGTPEQNTTTAGAQGKFSLLWAGLNTVRIRQRDRVTDELLPSGTGDPDQTVTLAKRPVVPGSVSLSVTASNKTEPWTPVDDLLAAGAEVYVPDPRWPPGIRPSAQNLAPSKVYVLDPESGEIRFGDGQRGTRPPLGAVLRASYDACQGRTGNVGAKAINTGPTLSAGFKVNNPVATWGGADAETVQDGEKQIARYLQHHDRLVTAEDFSNLARRTPGVEVGRVEVIPAYNPANKQNEPGDAPGVVTLMVLPRYDPLHPDAPSPDRLFLNTICDYLDSRRLVTTEVILKGPTYIDIWVTASIRAIPGTSIAEVIARVKTAIKDFLSPLPVESDSSSFNADGWPLRTPVVPMQLLAVASRVDGVLMVNDLQVAEEGAVLTSADSVEMNGLDLPRLLGLSVVSGALIPLETLREQVQGAAGSGGQQTASLPVPVIPDLCQ